MKANMTTLSIYELRKTIGLWKSRKITDSTISKLLDLYLGVTAYMNDEAVYPVENFYDLGLSLKFKNARCLVEAVRQSRSFGIVPDGNVYGMKSFYSYLWKAKDAAESLPETLPEELPEKFPQRIYNINIYIIIINLLKIFLKEIRFLRKNVWKLPGTSFMSSTKTRCRNCRSSFR